MRTKSERPKGKTTAGALPAGVAAMVESILAAVTSGRIEDLADAVDWNEMKPDLGPTYVSDPIAHWKAVSKDGTGAEVLAVLGALLAHKPAILPLGKDIENNRLYVWPAFAEQPLSKLTEAEREQLAVLATADAIAAMAKADRYTGWRLLLGADGTWHGFRSD